MNDRSAAVTAMCRHLRDEGRTIAWLGNSLGVPPALLRQLIDGRTDIPYVHWAKVQRWVDARTVKIPAKRHADGPGPEPQRMGPDPRLVGDPRPPRTKHPTKSNAVLSKEVDQLRTELSSLRDYVHHHIGAPSL